MVERRAHQMGREKSATTPRIVTLIQKTFFCIPWILVGSVQESWLRWFYEPKQDGTDFVDLVVG